MQTDWVIANALTKHDPNCMTMWDLQKYGRWQIGGNVRIRRTVKVADYEESDLRTMRVNDE